MDGAFRGRAIREPGIIPAIIINHILPLHPLHSLPAPLVQLHLQHRFGRKIRSGAGRSPGSERPDAGIHREICVGSREGG